MYAGTSKIILSKEDLVAAVQEYLNKRTTTELIEVGNIVYEYEGPTSGGHFVVTVQPLRATD